MIDRELLCVFHAANTVTKMGSLGQLLWGHTQGLTIVSLDQILIPG